MKAKMLKDLEEYYTNELHGYPYRFDELNESQIKTLKNSIGFSGWQLARAKKQLYDAVKNTKLIKYISGLI